MKHYSVLKNELIEGLNIKPDGIYVDATLGYAGDSKEILKRIKRGFLFGGWPGSSPQQCGQPSRSG